MEQLVRQEYKVKSAQLVHQAFRAKSEQLVQVA
jgi:hypothetical protein